MVIYAHDVNRIQAPQNMTKIVQYRVTNHSKRNHILILRPIQGISQIAEGDGVCSYPIILKSNHFCTLILAIDGSQLQNNNSGGPELCQRGGDGSPSPFQCYQPNQADILNITKSAMISTVIAGGYYDGTISRPMVALTQDGGATWRFPSDITDPSLSPNFSMNGAFYGKASCYSNTCVASGGYSDEQEVQRPLLALSQDGGSTWSFPTSITQPVLNPTFSNAGGLNGAECFEETCMAVGSYQDLNSIQRPLLALSRDAGVYWSYPSAITEAVGVQNFVSGSFADTRCTGHLCLAAGQYSDGITSYPIIAQTLDGSTDWYFPTSITTPILTPAYNNEGYFAYPPPR